MNDIYEKLNALGWIEYPDQFKPHARAFFKRFPDTAVCQDNDDKDGNQVCIYVYAPLYRETHSFEIEIYGGLKDGTSIKIQNYSLPNTIEGVLDQIPKLLKTWEFIANF